MSLYVGDRLVCRFGRNSIPSKPAYQTVTYIEWYTPDIVLMQLNLWQWALEFSKHVQNWNKHIKKSCASNWSLNRINQDMFYSVLQYLPPLLISLFVDRMLIFLYISSQYTRWFKYDRDWFVCKQAGYSPGHIWTNLYNDISEDGQYVKTCWSLKVSSFCTCTCMKVPFWLYCLMRGWLFRLHIYE